jgi:hypothetical protein
MSAERISAIISLVAAILVLVAAFFQWWDITFDGKMLTDPRPSSRTRPIDRRLKGEAPVATVRTNDRASVGRWFAFG